MLVCFDHNCLSRTARAVWHLMGVLKKISDGCISGQMAPTYLSRIFFLNTASENEIPLPSLKLVTGHHAGVFVLAGFRAD